MKKRVNELIVSKLFNITSHKNFFCTIRLLKNSHRDQNDVIKRSKPWCIQKNDHEVFATEIMAIAKTDAMDN